MILLKKKHQKETKLSAVKNGPVHPIQRLACNQLFFTYEGYGRLDNSLSRPRKNDYRL